TRGHKTHGHERHGHRSARLGLSGPGRPGGGRQNRGPEGVSSGPRLREARSQATRARRRHSPRKGKLLKGDEPALTLAAPKGRVLEEAIELFGRAGVDLRALKNGGRKLVHDIPKAGLRVLVIRDTDVPTYVEHGAADVGIVGSDVLEEQARELYEPLDLGIGR